MSQTILIEPNADLRKIFSINLNTFAGTDVILRSSAEDAINLLRILPQVNLIITKARVNDEATAIKIHQFLQDELLNIPMIIMGECPELSETVLALKEPINWESLLKNACDHLGVTLKDAKAKVKPDYLPVGIHYFYDIKTSPCDIFIRIKKDLSEFQFVKRINARDIFDQELIAKYEKQGLTEFYVPQDYIQYFTTYVTGLLMQKLESTELSVEERILTTSHSYDVVRDIINTAELDSAVVDLSHSSINSMISSVKSYPEIANVLKVLFFNKISFAYQHAHMVALMGHYILSKQSWYKPEHLNVLSFVSFFADITLKSPAQIQISSMKEFNEAQLNDQEREQVLNHAKDAVSILKDHPGLDHEYIKTVLLQSHGKLDGIGFEENPSEDLHPISKVFIIADCFVKIILNPKMPSQKSEVLPLLYNRFTNPSYVKIIKVLEKKYT